MNTIIFNHSRLARDHVEKFVFLFVPMSIRRTGPWLERLNIGAELCQSAHLRIAQQFEGSIALRPVLRALIVEWLIPSDDHLFPRAGARQMRRFDCLGRAAL